MQIAIAKPGIALALVVALGGGCSSGPQSSRRSGQESGAPASDASADRDSGAPLPDASPADGVGPGAPVHCSTGGATCEADGCCYVTPEGAGTKTGIDWDNAYADLPASLTRGVVYFLAGSTASYGSHVFDDPDRGTTPITLYKAVDCKSATTAPYCGGTNPASVAGWQASFGTSAAVWSDTPQADPIRHVGSLWQFCSDYYVIDGATGSTAPTAPGAQGFVLGTQNDELFGVVHIGNNGCGRCTSGPTGCPPGLTDLMFRHLEVKGTGLMPYYPASVTACSYSNGSATITTASSIGGIAGDVVSGWDSAYHTIFLGAKASSISTTRVVVPVASNPCGTLAHLALDFIPAIGFDAVNEEDLAETFTNVTLADSYVHDLSESLRSFNSKNLRVLHNYLARNRSTPTQHASILQLDEGSPQTTDGPVTIAYNLITDFNGTATISHLGQAAGCRSNCGTTNGLYIYANVFTCSSPSPGCGTGQGTISDNAGSSVVKNMVFYNNTVAVGYPAGSYLLSPDSTGAVVENNLFYDIPGTNAVRLNGTHDYNTLLNASLVYYAKCQGHETCIGSGASDPFVDDKGFDFHLKADMSAAASAGTETAEGVALDAPYDVDFNGRARGADGTWERGAYEF